MDTCFYFYSTGIDKTIKDKNNLTVEEFLQNQNSSVANSLLLAVRGETAIQYIIIFIFDFWELSCLFSWRLDDWSSFRAFQDSWSRLLTISFTKLVTEYLDSGSCIYKTELSCAGSPASRSRIIFNKSSIASIISKNLAFIQLPLPSSNKFDSVCLRRCEYFVLPVLGHTFWGISLTTFSVCLFSQDVINKGFMIWSLLDWIMFALELDRCWNSSELLLEENLLDAWVIVSNLKSSEIDSLGFVTTTMLQIIKTLLGFQMEGCWFYDQYEIILYIV